MRFELTAEEQAFREEMRGLFTSEVPASIRGRVAEGVALDRAEIVTSHRILNEHGLAVPHWPVEWGGRDWTPIQRYLWRDEMARTCTPTPQPFNTQLVGPVIAEFGSQEVKQRFLPPTANADIWWCQGFSEPEAGSDLASVKTQAIRDGADYVVNGQKTWTTGAHWADWIFALVRTDLQAPKRQAGISFLLIDMASSGVTVRPIRLLDGAHEVNEVFFEDVRVPAGNLVGEENRGWSYAKFLLGNERTHASTARPLLRQLDGAKRAAANAQLGSRSLLADPVFCARVAELETELHALEVTVLRVAAGSRDGKPNPVSSLLKLRTTELEQAVNELLVEVAGPHSRPLTVDADRSADWVHRAVPNYLNTRKATIYGGSSEVQRSIIASSILGL